MAAMDTITQLEAKVQDQLDKASEVKAQLEADVALHEQLKSEVAAELQAAKDQAYLDGKASVVLPDPASPDAIFTQADMDKLAQVAKEEQKAADQLVIDEIQGQIAALSQQVTDLQGQLEAQKAAADQSMAEYKAKVQAELDQDKAALA